MALDIWTLYQKKLSRKLLYLWEKDVKQIKQKYET
jgi:hypothetical protein